MGPGPAGIAHKVEFSNCPICETDASVLWMDDHKPTRYVRCTHCGTVYASPRASQLTRHKWMENTFRAGQLAFDNAAKRRSALGMEAAIIHRYVKGGVMLDIGCGPGDLFRWFPGPAWQKHGVDVSASAATYAAQTFSAQSNRLFAALSRSYFRLISSLADLSFHLLDLAPKYMCIAKLR